jgi:hypothetical protein
LIVPKAILSNESHFAHELEKTARTVPDKERGYYLHPDLYDQPVENGISRILFPEEKRELLKNKNTPI